MKDVNNILKKNRKILEGFIHHEKEITIHKNRIAEKGFQWTYHTHTSTNQSGITSFFCYEFGYIPIENQQLKIIRRSDDSFE